MTTGAQIVYPAEEVESLVRCVRGQKVILDTDLARLYGVATKVLNQAVKRHADRFPPDFLFQLTPQEAMDAQARPAIASSAEGGASQPVDAKSDRGDWSQIVTSSAKHRGASYRPFAFTEHGAIMAAAVLNSPRAVQMSVFVVRAFIKMREQLIVRSEMEKRLAEIEKSLLSHDTALRDLYSRIRSLLLPPPGPTPDRNPIGFSVRETRARYRARSKP